MMKGSTIMRHTCKKLFAMLLASAMSLSLLTACGSDDSAQTDTSTESDQTEETTTLDYPTKDIPWSCLTVQAVPPICASVACWMQFLTT